MILGIFALAFWVCVGVVIALMVGAIRAGKGTFEWTKTTNAFGYKLELQFCQAQPLAFLVTKNQ